MLSFGPTVSALLTNPLILLGVFVAASLLMIWRLHAIEGKGFEGTVVGTLIMPYCSGFANLVFAFVMSRTPGNGRLIIENSIVNNVTNLTLILGLVAIFYASGGSKPKGGTSGRAAHKTRARASAKPAAKSSNSGNSAKGEKSQANHYRLYRLDLLFTLVALFLFTGTLWALAKDRVLDFYDGLVLVGLFVFWQVLHVFEILKNNVRKNQRIHWSIVIDLLLIGASAYGIYLSVDFLVNWVTTAKNPYFSLANLGWLSGLLMVVPNAFLAFYFAHAGRQDIVVSSQVGDGHICIPMCIGLFALFDPIKVPGFFQTGIVIILGAGALHFLSIAILGRLPRFLGFVLLAGYGLFIYKGVVS